MALLCAVRGLDEDVVYVSDWHGLKMRGERMHHSTPEPKPAVVVMKTMAAQCRALP